MSVLLIIEYFLQAGTASSIVTRVHSRFSSLCTY